MMEMAGCPKRREPSAPSIAVFRNRPEDIERHSRWHTGEAGCRLIWGGPLLRIFISPQPCRTQKKTLGLDRARLGGRGAGCPSTTSHLDPSSTGPHPDYPAITEFQMPYIEPGLTLATRGAVEKMMMALFELRRFGQKQQLGGLFDHIQTWHDLAADRGQARVLIPLS